MPRMSDPDKMGVINAADILRSSKRTVVLTGAGISTPSGIPDFRSTNGGLWQRYDPFEVASLTAFRHHPEEFYNWMRGLACQIFNAKPNAAHFSLARLEEIGFLQTIITQNIDRLHQKAGSKNVLEVHGSFENLVCIRCFRKVTSDGYIEPYLEKGIIPHCPDCGGILKPNMILMGEQLPAKTWWEAQESSKKCDLMVVAGSSLEVLPVAGLPMRALENGAHLIIINQSPTYLDVRADVVLQEDVAEVIPGIVEVLESEIKARA